MSKGMSYQHPITLGRKSTFPIPDTRNFDARCSRIGLLITFGAPLGLEELYKLGFIDAANHEYKSFRYNHRVEGGFWISKNSVRPRNRY